MSSVAATHDMGASSGRPMFGNYIEVQRGKRGLFRRRLERARRAHLEPACFGPLMHRGRAQLLAASSAARRLGIDTGQIMPGLDQSGEDRHGKIRTAHEGDAKRLSHARALT